MKAWQQLDTHAALWLVLAFALGTLWVPAVELAAARFTVDGPMKVTTCWLTIYDGVKLEQPWKCYQFNDGPCTCGPEQGMDNEVQSD